MRHKQVSCPACVWSVGAGKVGFVKCVCELFPPACRRFACCSCNWLPSPHGMPSDGGERERERRGKTLKKKKIVPRRYRLVAGPPLASKPVSMTACPLFFNFCDPICSKLCIPKFLACCSVKKQIHPWWRPQNKGGLYVARHAHQPGGLAREIFARAKWTDHSVRQMSAPA